MTFIIIASPRKSCSLDPIPTKLHLLITRIINLFLSTHTVPQSIKHAIVTPLLKKPSLNCDILANYRPVSKSRFYNKTTFLSKLVERSANIQLMDHLENHNPLHERQSAYRKGYSTERALMRFFDDMHRAAYDGRATAVLFLDLSAPFTPLICHGVSVN